MARNFQRGPPTQADVQSGLDMEAEMRRLVAEKAALSVSRGPSPRGAYGAMPKSSTTKTKMQLWGMGSATTVSVPIMVEETGAEDSAGLHHHAFPRGAPRPPPPTPTTTRDDASSSKSRSSHDKNVLEDVLGIYPAENKLPPGKSAADEFVATIAKRFQLGRRKSSISSSTGRSISTVRSSSAAGGDAASYRSGVSGGGGGGGGGGSAANERRASNSIPENNPLVIIEPPRSTSRERGRGGETGDRLRARSRSKGRKGPKYVPPGPSNEGVYATMPLPAVPPSPSFQVPPSQILLSADTLAEKTRLAQSRGIDIAEWTESVSPRPPSAVTTVSDSQLSPTTDRRRHSHSSSSSRASLYIKRLSFHRPTPEMQAPPFTAFSRRRKPSTRMSVSSAGSNVAFPYAYDLSESGSTGSSSARAERTSQPPPASPPRRQPASPPQAPSIPTDSGFYGESDDDMSFYLHRDSDEETLHLPDTLDEIFDKMDLTDLESSTTTEVPQDDSEEEEEEEEEKGYCGADIYDEYTRASLLFPKDEAYDWKDRRRGTIFMGNPKPPIARPPVKTGLDAEIETYLAERRRLMQQ